VDVISTAALTDSVYLSILTVTEEPMFSSSEGYVLRILIDSDDSAETGYSLPSIGADQMIEIYGKNNAIMSSVLYTFNDNRDSSDWNGFSALSTINARALGDTVEMQVPLFDLGASNQDEMKIVWQSSDGNGNTDLADNIVSLSGEKLTISGAIGSLIDDSNTLNEGQGVVIDGYFGDWSDIEKQFDVISSAESEHVDLEQYAAVTQDENTFMYMNVKGNILNGIAIPAYGAKSMPDLNTGSTGDTEPTAGVSNQESTPLPVISSEDTIYVLIDTDNNPMTGYSSIGMSIGAEKMVEIKGHYGIITQRVMKEWTGSESGDWEWATGEIVDAAASGSEIELEVVDGKFWIHIVGWNGDDDSSLSFETIENGGRYVDIGNCYLYYRFNGNLADTCTTNSAGGLLTNSGADTDSAGKMGNGLTVEGGEYVTGSASGITMAADWSVEAWIKPSTIGDGIIFAIADDTTEKDNELSIHLGGTGGDELVVCSGGEIVCAKTNSDTVTSTGTWYHVAVTYDHSDSQVDLYVDNVREITDNSFVSFTGNPSGAGVMIGSGDEGTVADFKGVIDEVRMVNYQRMAFAGGIMLSKMVPPASFPGTATVSIYNAGEDTIDLAGIKLWNAEGECNGFTGTVGAGLTSTVSCTVSTDDGLWLADIDGDNLGGADVGNDADSKEWTIDGVCWNDGGGTDTACGSGQPMIDAGVWSEDTYVDTSGAGSGWYLQLKTLGNNDEAVSDWEAIPEFSTLLMPIASVLMIVGYNYRRKNLPEA
jgi:hypothetical protein